MHGYHHCGRPYDFHHHHSPGASDSRWACPSRAGAWGQRGWGRGGERSGPWGDWFGGPPPRADRGGVRYLILNAILDRPRHGYEIISVIEEKCRGGYRPSPGVVYPTLQMLEELQHVRSVELEGRRVYEITEAGRQDLEAHREEVSDFYDRLNEDSWEAQIDSFGELARLIGQLLKTVRRSARRGRLASSTIGKIRDIVGDAIKQIEKVLADEE